MPSANHQPYGQTSQPSGRHRCAHELFEENACLAPDAPAVISREECLSYRELNTYANGIARELAANGVKPEAPVAIYMNNSPAMIAALLGILKAGGAFVPIDPSYPAGRVEYIVSDSKPVAVIVSEQLKGCVANYGVKVLCASDYRNSEADRHLPCPPCYPAPEDSACILYTSGSTGRPKGVVRTQQGLLARFAWVLFEKDDVFCHNMSLCYGFSQERLLLPLMKGLPLVVMSDESGKDSASFAADVNEFAITSVTVVPAFLEQLLNDEAGVARLTSLRKVAVGGAPLSLSLIQRFVRALPRARLINAYGGTEAGSAARADVTSASSGPVVIGQPVPGAIIRILDENLQPVADGAIGELCVGGHGIARGYLGQPDLTARQFIRSPFVHDAHRTLYRTGDMGRWLAGGTIELKGRSDRQVKIRGFRVELEEIETILKNLPEISDAVLTARDSGNGARLVAYVVTEQPLSVTALRKHLMQTLPDHMLPSAYVLIPELPRTPNGKIAMGSLPAPPALRPDLDTPYVAPLTLLERAIASIWAEALNVEEIGRDDHFLDLGGDSLLAVQIADRIEAQTGISVSPLSLLEQPTVAQLAASLAELQDTQSDAPWSANGISSSHGVFAEVHNG